MSSKPIEELILKQPITPEFINRLFYIYKDDWKKYVNQMTEILDQEILNKIQHIRLLVDRIDMHPSCENVYNIKEQLFDEKKKRIFCQWLFKSHTLCLNADERIVGRKIEHNFPVTLKIYLNKNLANRIKSIQDERVKIAQFNDATERILDNFKSYLEENNYFFKPVGAVTTESSFDSIEVSLGFYTYYTKSEDIYIKTFVKNIINNEKKLKEAKESLEQSEEGIFNGRFFKKDKIESNKLLQYKFRPTWMKDFVSSSNKLFCSHFKELESYVTYKGYKIATKNDIAKLSHNFFKCKDYRSPEYECSKTIGKFTFSCCSYNNSGSAHLYVINSKNKIETIKYIGGVLTKKTAFQQTVIIT